MLWTVYSVPDKERWSEKRLHYILSTEIVPGSILAKFCVNLDQNQPRFVWLEQQPISLLQNVLINKQGTPVLVYKPYTYKSFIFILITYKKITTIINQS